ncbi:hypothetical protein E1B28_012114 [Marasmius oreades]|uniref:Uncharacterized protein n=1 Tax=Marasmius oreades TaxID=181124 RepID=A0A9P7UNC5_9AGAR|nr:uncharacterized protein E1B28_012114 [Marasmius oreades]KAG7088083.1 hypothetical protein E1B28_012114 [Marasmius oreades]
MPNLLLESLDSFPIPPSFIPPSPRSPTLNTAIANPPPSRPPSVPLPPIPGPSRISESDAALLLGSTRNSKYSTSSRTDSIASLASAKSNGFHYTYSPNDRTRRRDSTSSSLSNSSKASRSVSDRSLRGHEAIRESHLEDRDDISIFDPADAYGGTASSGDEVERQEQLTKIRLSPMPVDNDQHLAPDNNYSPPLSARFPQPPPLSSKDHDRLTIKRLSLSSSVSSASASKGLPLTHKEPSFRHRDIETPESGDISISSISMHDLPPDDDFGSGEEFDIPTTTNYPLPPRIQRPPSSKILTMNQPPTVPHPSLLTPGTPLSPGTPLICQTPPTPQSPAFRPPPSPHTSVLPPTSRQGRTRSSISKPVAPSDCDDSSDLGGLQPLTLTSVATPTPTIATESPSQSFPEQHSHAPIEFPTKIQFPPSADYILTDDPLLLHRELRSARSRSISHKKRLNGSKQTTPESSPVPEQPGDDTFQSNAVLPQTTRSSSVSISVAERATGKRAMTVPPPSSFKTNTSKQATDSRANSPDIEDLLETTPRPRRGSSSGKLSGRTSVSSYRSGRSRSASMPRKNRQTVSSTANPDVQRRASEGLSRESRESRFARLERELEGIGSDEESLGGYPADQGRLFEDARRSTGSDDLLMEDDEGSASDSSLDIHTPLPHLLLRDGALSHKSKLLPSTSLSSTDSVESLTSLTGRPGSVISVRSTDSKASLFKDTRDTPVRRLRHKDGKLLKGGLGLTTGLGWSDSEDEDAPSPLTRRLSSVVLSKKTSLISLARGRPSSNIHESKSHGNLRASSYSTRSGNSSGFSRRPSDLSSSQSTTTLLEADEFECSDDDSYASATYHGYSPGTQQVRGLISSGMPPSSWQRGFRQANSIGSRRGVSSASSLALSIPPPATTPNSKACGKILSRSTSESSIRGPAHFQYAAPEELSKTPSSSSSVSSVSIPAPLTPKDDEVHTPTPHSVIRTDPNKILPPLPNPKTGSIRRPAAPGLAARFASPGYTSPRGRSNSIGTTLSTSSSAPAVSDAPPLPNTGISASSSTSSLKPLKLPRYSAGVSQKPALVPTVSGTENQLHTSPTPTPTLPTTPLTISSGLPKPRTGTGMTYRKSSSSQTLRMPSSPMLRTPSATRF